MKCGICGSDNPTYESRGHYGIDPMRVLIVHDAGDLVRHKRQQHPDEYEAGLQKRKDTKAEHERIAEDYRQRRRAAGDAAGRAVLYRVPYGEYPIEVRTIRGIDLYFRLEEYRYPQEHHMAAYYALLEEIARLQGLADQEIRAAFDQGDPVPQEDVERVKAAMDAVEKPS